MTLPRKKAPPQQPPPLVRPVSLHVMESYLNCHSDGHQWRLIGGWVDPIDAEPGMRPPFNQLARGRRSHCESCGGNRLRWYTVGGEVHNKYDMPDGYYHKRASKDDDTPAPTRQEWRKLLVANVFETDLRPARNSRAS